MAEAKATTPEGDFINAAGGAHLIMQPTGRIMKYYPVAKIELEAISAFNGISTAFFSLASALLMLLAGFIWDLSITGPFSTGNKTAAIAMIVIFAGAMLVSIFVAFLFQRKKEDKTEEILKSVGEFDALSDTRTRPGTLPDACN